MPGKEKKSTPFFHLMYTVILKNGATLFCGKVAAFNGIMCAV